MVLNKPLLSYDFWEEVIELFKYYWNKKSLPRTASYILTYPEINRGVKWRCNCIIADKKVR